MDLNFVEMETKTSEQRKIIAAEFRKLLKDEREREDRENEELQNLLRRAAENVITEARQL